jgi:spore coat polysaccharide biosynthesis protein SpsF (cytidylyltransferase family)
LTTAAIVQARMGSTRLPGKTLMDLGGVPVVDWVTRRLAMTAGLDDVLVATSDQPADDVLARHLVGSGQRVVRGPADDVLGRFQQALGATDADTVVRITADCPFVQPELISLGLTTFFECGADYLGTALDGRLPRGFDLEVIRRGAVESAALEAHDPVEREHVTTFVLRRPERFHHAALPAPEWARRPGYRICLDEPPDLSVLRAVVDGLGATPESLDGRAVISFLDANPQVVALNRSVVHRIVV